MEIRARYTLMGAFTLAVIFMVFAFIYWLHNSGGLGERREMRVMFNSVSGLLPGSAVFFNGIRVGEVRRLDLRPDNPSQVQVTLSIDAFTPIRSDTKVGLEFQGLTGVSVVTLSGGTPNAAPLNADDTGAPVLVAGANVGQSLTQAAQGTLERFNAILDDSAPPLHDTLNNVKTFSEALARNSDRVDGIMSGLERMTGGSSKAKGPTYDLTPATQFPSGVKVPEKQLGIAELTAPAVLDNDKIQMRKTATETGTIDGGQWSDPVPRLLQLRLVQSFENAGFGGHVGRPSEGLTPDLTLQIDLRGFQIDAQNSPSAEIGFGAKILNTDGKIVSSKVFGAKAPAKAVDASGATQALNDAFKDAAGQLVAWVSETVANQPDAPAEPAADAGGAANGDAPAAQR